jgi:hypothetical protein
MFGKLHAVAGFVVGTHRPQVLPIDSTAEDGVQVSTRPPVELKYMTPVGSDTAAMQFHTLNSDLTKEVSECECGQNNDENSLLHVQDLECATRFDIVRKFSDVGDDSGV